MTLLGILFLFSIIIIVHEFGHFIAARRAGIRVISFNIGFGPVLWAKQKAKTLYALRLIPLGGAVQLAGLDESAPSRVSAKEKYPNKTWLQRFLVIISGSILNVLLGLVVFIIFYMVIGIPQNISNTIDFVERGSPAAKAGILAEDKIIQVNDYQVGEIKKAIEIIHQTPAGRNIRMVVLRKNKCLVKIIPVEYNTQLKISYIGILLKPIDFQRQSLLKALEYGTADTLNFIYGFYEGLKYLFGGNMWQNISGPVGIAEISAEAVRRGWSAYLRLLAVLSINIGLLNLLPFPALDGGRLIFLFWELITHRKQNEQIEKIVHLIGFMILLLAVIIVTYFDLLRLWSK